METVTPILKPDRDVMLGHLAALFGRAMTGRIEITAIKVDKDGERTAPRTRFFDVDELDEAADYAASVNAEHLWNVYVGAATRIPDVFPGKAATDDDFHRAWAIHADVDDGHNLDAVREKYRALGITPPIVVVTGRTPTTRAQMWWPLEDPITDPDLYRRTLRAVASALHTDPSVTTAKQLMRLAGGVNWPKKDGRVLEKTEVIHPSQAQQAFSLEQLHRAFPLDAPKETQPHTDERPGTLLGALAARDLRSALASMRSDDRHLWVRMGHALKELGEQGRGLWLEWSQTSDLYDPVDAARVWDSLHPQRTGYQAVFAEAQRKGWINPGRGVTADVTPSEPKIDPETGEVLEPTDLLEPCTFDGLIPPPRPWAWGTMLMYMAVTGIAAPPGVGKTTFSFQVAIAFAMNLQLGPWGPVAGGGGKAWLYNGEEPNDELTRRYLAACAEMGMQPHDVAQRVAYNSGLNRRLTLVNIDPATGEAARSPDVDKIKAKIVAGGFKLFLIDPLIEFHDAKEDTQGLHAIGAVLREIAHDCNCAVLFFHHTPKAANSDTAAGDMNAMRGGGPIIGVARFVLTMFSMTVKDAEELQIPAKDRVRYVRVDDAKANMALMSAEPQWWKKLGVCIENADDVRPADNIGVLRYAPLSTADGPLGIEDTMKRAREQEAMLDRIAEEMARVCRLNGWTASDKAGALDTVVSGMVREKSGYGPTVAKAHIVGSMGSARDVDGGRVVITDHMRGSMTVRKVHFEGERND